METPASLKARMSDTLRIAGEYRTTYIACGERLQRTDPAQKAALLDQQQKILQAWMAEMRCYERLSKQYIALLRA